MPETFALRLVGGGGGQDTHASLPGAEMGMRLVSAPVDNHVSRTISNLFIASGGNWVDYDRCILFANLYAP